MAEAMRGRISRALALGATAAAITVAACGADEEMPPPEVKPVGPPAADAAAAPEPKILELPHGGNAIVQVRRDRRVDLHEEPGGRVIETIGDETEWGSPTVFYVDRVRGPWAAVPTPYFENGRLAWLRLDAAKLRAGRVDWEIEVDLSDYQATLLHDDRRVRTFSVSIGMPGAETPTGNFAVTDTFRGDLNPAYGCCAVALTARQSRLPSGWLGGDRIAIHGTSGPLGAAISQGCVRAADDDVSDLVDRVPPGTPVVIRQ